MKLSRKMMSFLLTALMVLILLPAAAMKIGASNMYENSDFIETEQPELSEESKQLISLYQKNPTVENYLNLRNNVIDNYNAVLERKEAKLAELKTETAGKPGGDAIVAEMEEIVQEMYITYWSRINSSMLRFTDTRLLKWKISNAAQYEYIPVMGAGESIYVKRTSVTNAEYAEFVTATGAQAPSNWSDGTYPAGEDNYPVNLVSYEDAENYCDWLTEQDGVDTYRLPNESEWELAAGHMPKDADFNCGVNDGRTPVEQYADVTRGAHGAIDFWGNVWEWTSTVRDNSNGITTLGVKGGSWKSSRTDCRTECREEGRDDSRGYEDVGFRVIQVLNGIEPEQKVELATLASPVVSATSTAPDSITLSWQPVDGAIEYQLFEYFEETGLVQMLETTKETSVTMRDLVTGSTHQYIVQPIAYIEIADNVSSENSVVATCGQETNTADWQTAIVLQIDNPMLTVNGEEKNIDDNGTVPLLMNDRTLVPIRAIVEAMGGTVEWNQDLQTAVLMMNGIEIRLVIDSTIAYLNGEEKI
ncbi:SUMF1/EgtB/PvdO family nonheme iron enzyme [Acetivibrio sp. MSJd-27]|uniref:SUMF1/EgtB/PvdO family nonheme iron enzyme n=1 Tax=Acetivibrio sp. MSJd-27 TaxID=2841523 RepID=UPI001C10645C|nr:SUMF1/EgtB/PvdO family nonheme iron enzyme [Acetivibrio sp. MSJd-27]MBU5450396.1 SUMF1/EgtB/PvdO family nonheme iron enzyme [Acetivibrio sp. MSJd-27]